MKIIHSTPESGSACRANRFGLVRSVRTERRRFKRPAALGQARIGTSGQSPYKQRRARFERQSVSCKASPRALIRLSISDFSVMNGGANWMVSPP